MVAAAAAATMTTAAATTATAAAHRQDKRQKGEKGHDGERRAGDLLSYPGRADSVGLTLVSRANEERFSLHEAISLERTE